jgi:carbamoyltransferase
MIILGLTHPISWNNAACILVDGKLVAMAEEERFNRIKHAPRMAPSQAMQYCLDEAGIELEGVDYVAIGFDHYLQVAQRNLQSEPFPANFNQAAMWLIQGFKQQRMLPLAGYDPSRIIFVNHHHAHAASTYYASGFGESMILSLDGSGGSESGFLGLGRNKSIEMLHRITNRGSWGLVYEDITEKLGFRRHSGEGKVMGLAAYGQPDPDGLPFIDWNTEIPSVIPSMRRAFMNRLIQRDTDAPITQAHKDLAATLQDSLERVSMRMVEWLFNQSSIPYLCLSGGTALNCSMNGKLASLPFIEDIFIQPAAHDAGTALGAALSVFTDLNGHRPEWRMNHAYWGPSYSNEEIEAVLRQMEEIHYRRSDDIARDAAQAIAKGRILGWFQGRMEIGPRALGNRSIIADPSRADMKDRVNKQVKEREPWRPFAPSILEQAADRYLVDPRRSPFMILAFDTLPGTRDEIQSAIHVDNTCRPQTVNKEDNPRYWRLIDEFHKLTSIPAILNTSFNLNTQPIVNTPEQAVQTLLNSGLEGLAIGDYLVSKINA